MKRFLTHDLERRTIGLRTVGSGAEPPPTRNRPGAHISCRSRLLPAIFIRSLAALAQSLSALYPMGTEEKRWVDGVLARKKGFSF